MGEVARMDDDVSSQVAWTLLVFGVPLVISVVTFTMGPIAFFWGFLLALSLFGVLLMLSLDLER